MMRIERLIAHFLRTGLNFDLGHDFCSKLTIIRVPLIVNERSAGRNLVKRPLLCIFIVPERFSDHSRKFFFQKVEVSKCFDF